MANYIKATIGVILDRTADELIGGLLVALVLSLALAGAFAFLRQKVRDTTTLITCLALAANLVVMGLSAGFVRNADSRGLQLDTGPSRRLPVVMSDRGVSLARKVFEQADSDRDGLLSRKEAATAADSFVTWAEQVEGSTLNEGLLQSALRRHMVPPGDPARVGSNPPIPASTSAP